MLEAPGFTTFAALMLFAFC
jgi:hypothetical protein